MKKIWRKLDNNAKFFSLEEKKYNNVFRLSVLLKEKVDSNILRSALLKTLDKYPSYKVKLRTGIFWNYLDFNSNALVVEEEKNPLNKFLNFNKNNDYLFKVTYFGKKINLDIFHVLTDGIGATNFMKDILYNYLDLKYDLKTSDKKEFSRIKFVDDVHSKNVDKHLGCHKSSKKVFYIKEKANQLKNKTIHYILNLDKFKELCKKYKVTITEYLTALYIYAIYKTVYEKASNKDIVVTIPIDLRKYFNVQTINNFFTYMNVEGNISKNKKMTFNKILKQVHKEFKNKLSLENAKKYLARDVKLGTNIAIRLVPLFIKKAFIKHTTKLISKNTTTLSNLGSIKILDRYKKYIDNIMVLVSTGKTQKAKCTICSYENQLTITLNSSIVNNNLEKEFYKLLLKHVGKVKLISNEIY